MISSAITEKSIKSTYYMTKRKRNEARRAYILTLPFLGYMLLWSAVPVVFGLYLAFTDFNGLNKMNFVGFKNFSFFFNSGTYLKLLFRQIWLGGLQVSITMTLSFFLALALNKQYKIRGLFRAIIYMPVISAVSATTGVFLALLDPYSGGINGLIRYFGGIPITWNYSAFWMFFWIVFYNIWRGIGPSAILWLGGLQGIDPSLYEAARVDGSNKWQEIRYITLPGLRFIIIYIMLTGIINAMQMFDTVMFISRGLPAQQTDVLMYRIYRDGFLNSNYGMAGASSWILGVVVLVLALGYYRLARRSID